MITEQNRKNLMDITTNILLEVEERWRGKSFLDRLFRPYVYTYVTWDDVGDTIDKILKELGVDK